MLAGNGLKGWLKLKFDRADGSWSLGNPTDALPSASAVWQSTRAANWHAAANLSIFDAKVCLYIHLSCRAETGTNTPLVLFKMDLFTFFLNVFNLFLQPLTTSKKALRPCCSKVFLHMKSWTCRETCHGLSKLRNQPFQQLFSTFVLCQTQLWKAAVKGYKG